jgi:DNA modification methylase
MNKIEFGNCIDIMQRWIDEGVKVNMCVTSPPYYGLRDYGTATWEGGNPNCNHKGAKINPLKVGGFTGKRLRKENGSENEKYLSFKNVCPDCNAIKKDNQLGLEETPKQYIDNMVRVFRLVRELLTDDGTLWVNIGDSYSSHKDCKSIGQTLAKGTSRENAHVMNKGISRVRDSKMLKSQGLKNKDLIGIPWMLAFALREDGWYLRQDIIWHKPNPMPESVRDRCTKSHEYIFLLSKSPKYYFDNESIKENAIHSNEKRNKRDVWSVNVKPYKGAHFATFPMELIEPCIKAGCPDGGVVLDPFMGSGTTAQVAFINNKQYLGCELNLDYKNLQQERILLI